MTGARAIALDGLDLRIREAPPGEGTPVSAGGDERYRWLWFGAGSPELGASEAARLFDDPAGLVRFPGVWALFLVDLAERRALCAADRLGIQAVYYRPGTGFVSTNPMWLLTATGHDGSYSAEGLEDHLGFGYAIHPERQLYAGVSRIAPAGYLLLGEGRARAGTYWSGEAESREEPDLDALVSILGEACETPERRPYFGLTAGKDSLCLAAVARGGTGLTFGHPDSADRVQGGELAAVLGWPHRSATLCDPERFPRWIEWIAEHSAGLTTASYADMLDAIERTVDPGGAFVMGEAGECVRDFFRGGGGESPVDYLARNYVTPLEFLERTLVAGARPGPGYARRLLKRAGLLEGDPARAALAFYRHCRMPGNFAQRNAVLAPLRAKLAPFADARFLESAHGLGSGWFRGSGLHRAIIERARPALLPFFDAPRAGGAAPQDFPARMRGPLRAVLREFFEQHAPGLPDCWDRAGILALLDADPFPPRAAYYLLRLAPLASAQPMKRESTSSRR